MRNIYGINRVMEPNHVLPTSAWRINNDRDIYPNELRINVQKIHIESTSFRQICIECNNNMERIKERILHIVEKRGKLHNPVTDTGGVIFGTVEEIGEEYENTKGLKVGDEIICNASLAGIPLFLTHISKVDMAYTQVDAGGYAILFNKVPVVKKPEDLPINLMLYTFDESGTLYSAYKSAKNKKRCLVVGNSLLTNLLFGRAIRKSAGDDAEIICLFDNNTDIGIRGKELKDILEKTFSEVHYVNILKPVESLEKLDVGLFDVSVNCADIPGAETINILSTKPGGTVYFANLINNYNIALYITEAISREIQIKCADGYEEEYAEFDIELMRDIAPYVANSKLDSYKIVDNIAYSLRKNKYGYEQTVYQKTLLDDFICNSSAMATVVDEILSVAKYDCNVLITGDTGVGKERVASLIQKNSNRNMQPYIKINCASIADNLIESEFFGYEKGAFTGANAGGKKGYFELGDNGIIFLDEVGELPMDLQAKLLRAIQDGEFYRVGGTVPIKTNVRIVSATNRDLEQLIEEKRFRKDLYYRLNVFPIRVPNLDERKAEIPNLVQHFFRKYNAKFGTVRTITPDALEYLQGCSWPGNIRELENVVQRLLISARNENISVFDVTKELHSDLYSSVNIDFNQEEFDTNKELTLDTMVNNFERSIMQFAYEKYGSSRKAAKALGISQTQFIRKKNKYNICLPEREE
ncbi:sigma-54 dependent transcriptional regulator [Sinanaerobacter sp. ZZT-01]|uniref:sigma-54 interaction domain-containing protein n=1 Tax=Sinanaerobacter sp. ZZT-01 TaxID=3111540 RepID=UPI002D7784CE|nr:sigma-54 dependent transcriptional regulator [Sinanaerobacter sp. ZZT-01]WRR94542.1 sigma-54 dependent transcriptional regulator [Sinanaerobacter sp. ZZT-01]